MGSNWYIQANHDWYNWEHHQTLLLGFPRTHEYSIILIYIMYLLVLWDKSWFTSLISIPSFSMQKSCENLFYTVIFLSVSLSSSFFQKVNRVHTYSFRLQSIFIVNIPFTLFLKHSSAHYYEILSTGLRRYRFVINKELAPVKGAAH